MALFNNKKTTLSANFQEVPITKVAIALGGYLLLLIYPCFEILHASFNDNYQAFAPTHHGIALTSSVLFVLLARSSIQRSLNTAGTKQTVDVN